MLAQRLRHVIEIQRRTNVADTVGQPVAVWSEFATVRAGCSTSRGREYFAAAGIHAETPMMFTCHWLTGVDATMRVVYDGRAWQIVSVENWMEMGREMHLYCAAIDGEEVSL